VEAEAETTTGMVRPANFTWTVMVGGELSMSVSPLLDRARGAELYNAVGCRLGVARSVVTDNSVIVFQNFILF
jgi:hypothetical protein